MAPVCSVSGVQAKVAVRLLHAGKPWAACSMPEVACHVEALVVAIEHEHAAAGRARLPIKLTQQEDGT